MFGATLVNGKLYCCQFLVNTSFLLRLVGQHEMLLLRCWSTDNVLAATAWSTECSCCDYLVPRKCSRCDCGLQKLVQSNDFANAIATALDQPAGSLTKEVHPTLLCSKNCCDLLRHHRSFGPVCRKSHKISASEVALFQAPGL